MLSKAGFLKVLLLWLMLQGLYARNRKKMVKDGCKPKPLTSLTKHQVETTLSLFNEANGRHLGIWLPGFPALTPQNSFSADKVQCSLLFLAQGLKKILEDQRDNLNPEDVPLHKALRDSISRVDLLAACLQSIQGGKCSSQPAPPIMPQKTFERKQWSHTLLTAATQYLHWLQGRLLWHSLKKSWFMQTSTRPKYLTFLRGSRYRL